MDSKQELSPINLSDRFQQQLNRLNLFLHDRLSAIDPFMLKTLKAYDEQILRWAINLWVNDSLSDAELYPNFLAKMGQPMAGQELNRGYGKSVDRFFKSMSIQISSTHLGDEPTVKGKARGSRQVTFLIVEELMNAYNRYKPINPRRSSEIKLAARKIFITGADIASQIEDVVYDKELMDNISRHILNGDSQELKSLFSTFIDQPPMKS
ncbi:MAG: hypothetical protein AAB874_06635 [Patescibacteria group bacterium]